MNNYALILAGGSGTRFWPLSRDHKPKQLLNLFGNGSLLKQAISRLDGLVPNHQIFILTNHLQEEEVRRQASDIPACNIISEPVRRDTAPAIALGIGIIKSIDPKANMIVIPSDQLIQDDQAFKSLMRDALTAAEEQQALITVGIKPTWPCPSYGYIQRGDIVPTPNLSHECREVLNFKEKPDMDTARSYLSQGNYCWNAGMFVWNVNTVHRQLEKYCPELAHFVDTLSESPAPEETITTLFPELTPISIDFALMEKADRVLNFEASFDWDDVGSWISVATYLATQMENKTNTDITAQDSKGNIIFSLDTQKHVALLGVEDLIVVDTPDALLVADKNKADDIKKIVNQLPDHLI